MEGSEIRAPLILHLSTRWRLVELNAVVAFTLHNEPPVHIKRQVWWRAEPSGHVLEDEHLIPPPPAGNVISLPLSSSLQPVHCYRTWKNYF